MDFLKLKSIDLEAEQLVMNIELVRMKAQESNQKLKDLNPKRSALYQEIKEKYKIADQFTYNRETGEIIENKPAVP